MIPLTTIQGLSQDEIQSVVNDRDIYIWGAGSIAIDVFISLKSSGLKPKAFLDSRVISERQHSKGIPILHPDYVLNSSFDQRKSFIVIASATFGKQAEIILSKNTNLQKGIDYINYHSVSRPVAVIDVSGMCNLKCLSCPRGNMNELMSEGYMSYETYKKVFKKLRKDIPLLTKIELFSWGEPLLNHELSKIIKLTEQFVPCVISTNLMVNCNLEEIIKSQPTEFNITINSAAKSYEKVMVGASWNRLMQNLYNLSLLVKYHKPKTKITLKLYTYRLDSKKEMQKILSVAQELNFPLEFCQTYLNPYDNILAYANEEVISESSKFVLNNLPWDINKALALARRDINRPCLSQRLFPIINWDLSVSLCHTYYYPIIADNYLKIDWADLLSLRHRAKHCYLCQKYALHRLDLDILSKRYPKEILKVYRRKNGTRNINA